MTTKTLTNTSSTVSRTTDIIDTLSSKSHNGIEPTNTANTINTTNTTNTKSSIKPSKNNTYQKHFEIKGRKKVNHQIQIHQILKHLI